VTPVAPALTLQHTIGNRATRRALARYEVHAITVCRAGDTLPVEVRDGFSKPPDPAWSGRHKISPTGFMTFADATQSFTVQVGGLELVWAAQRIADAFFDHGVFEDPQVGVTSVDGYAAAGSGSTKARQAAEAKAIESYRNYIADVQGEADAKRRYLRWLSEHEVLSELSKTSPAEVWALALKPPPGPDPRDRHVQEFLDFYRMEQRLDSEVTDPIERARRVETASRYLDWLDRNKEARGFLKHSAPSVWADLSVAVLKEDIEKSVRKQIDEEKERKFFSPEAQEARGKKWDEFFALALKLKGYSARKYPYVIPAPSQGKDVLVWGDPATQQVLDDVAKALLQWASDHMHDADFDRATPVVVLDDLMKHGGYRARLDAAAKVPLQHEWVDRNEIVPEKAWAAFGETVLTGLAVIGIVAVFVGAEVITAQATWILVGVAGAGGVKSYLDRRDEIEKSGVEVPIPATIVHSAGDVIGVSQIVEAYTGQRLGTDRPLGSELRSGQAGVGGGSMATLLLGSHMFRVGETLGEQFKVPESPRLPSGPNANVTDVKVPDAPMPKQPAPSLRPAALESQARAGLPKELQLGFDKWMEDIRARGGEPEKVLTGKPAREVERISQSFARKYAGEVARAEEAAYLRERAADNPLRPILKNVKQVGDRVWIHYETQPPSATVYRRFAAWSGDPDPGKLRLHDAHGLMAAGIFASASETEMPLARIAIPEPPIPDASGWRREEHGEVTFLERDGPIDSALVRVLAGPAAGFVLRGTGGAIDWFTVDSDGERRGGVARGHEQLVAALPSWALN